MSEHFVICLFIYLSIVINCTAFNQLIPEEKLRDILRNVYEKNATTSCYKYQNAKWKFLNDLHDTKLMEDYISESTTRAANKKYYKDVYNLDIDQYEDESIKRTLRNVRLIDAAALTQEDYKKFMENLVQMRIVYASTKMCPYKKQNCNTRNEGLSISEVEYLMRTTNDIEESLYLWNTSSNLLGVNLMERYIVYVDLLNKASTMNGFKDASEMWKRQYEMEKFDKNIDELWKEIKPLYDEILVFVKGKLKKANVINEKLISMHIIGSFSGENWRKLAKISTPFPKIKTYDDAKLQYTLEEAFLVSDGFFSSMGFDSFSEILRDNSTLQQQNVSAECRPETYYFCNNSAVKLKLCPNVNYDNLRLLNCELGKVQYYRVAQNQSISSRESPNPILFEAVANLFGLLVNPTYFLDGNGDTDEFYVNVLMEQALRIVVSLPFYLLADKWRWDVFSNKINTNEWNNVWWQYREQIQGVKPPMNDSLSKHFDPAMQYNIITSEQYINKFLGTIVQFQIYKALCTEAEIYPKVSLHRCNLYNSQKAGQKLRDALIFGESKSWPDVLRTLTNDSNVNVTSLLEYFDPLYRYLKLENLKDEDHLRSFLENEYENRMEEIYHNEMVATYDFHTDLSNRNKEDVYINAKLKTSFTKKDYYQKYFQYLDVSNYKNETLKRHVKLLKSIGVDILDDSKIFEFTNLVKNMTKTYNLAKICPYQKQICNLHDEGLNFKPDIENVLATSFDYDELDYIWKSWQSVTGNKMKQQYERYVELWNEASKLNGYEDCGVYRSSLYDEEQFVDEIDDLWKLVKPLYNILHRYAIKKLKEKYSDTYFADGLIPAHLLGSMWGENWIKLHDVLRPYPKLKQPDPDNILKDNYTILEIFEKANDFYKSLGLDDCSVSYKSKNSMIKRPMGKEVDCDFRAYDMYDRKDYRLQTCSNLSFNGFLEAFHSIGYVQQFVFYKDQLTTFRTSSNPGLSYAIGQAIGLSVLTQEYLHKIGLLKFYIHIKETEINNLMEIALYKIAFLPFGYLIDKWRWDVLHGSIPEKNWNKHWWYLKKTYQKVKPPTPSRLEERDFDPSIEFHVTYDTDFIGYFMAIILQFQLHRGLCAVAGEYDPHDVNKPLHKCNIYGSLAAGDKLRAGLSLGSSKNWRDVLYLITGENKLDASALLEYFDPLYEELIEENEEVDNSLEIATGFIIGILAVVLIYLAAKWFYQPADET